MATIISISPAGSESFKTHNGLLATTIQINSEAGGAVAATITGMRSDGISLDWDGGDVFDMTSPIIGSTLSLSLLVDHHDELNALRSMIALGEADTWIRVAFSNGQKWYGNLLPEESSTELTDGLTSVTLTFADGLGLLKDIDFKADDGRRFSEGTTSITASGNLLKWAYLALNKIPWMQEAIVNATLVRETPMLEPFDGAQAGFYGTALSDSFTKVNSFEIRREGADSDSRDLPRPDSFLSTYDVLVDICQALGYRLCWNMDGWHFFSPYNSTSDYSLTSHTSYTWANTDFSTIDTGSQGHDVAAARTTSAFDPSVEIDSAYALTSAKSTFSIPIGSTYGTHVGVGGANILAPARGFGGSHLDTSSWGLWQAPRSIFQDSGMDIEDGAPMRMRFHSYFEAWNYTDGTNWQPRAGMKPCLVLRVVCGTESGTTHYLKGDVKSAPENTKLEGAGSDYFGQAWDVFDDATWTTNSDDLFYIPFNHHAHSAPDPEMITYLNSDGDTIYSFPMPFNAKLKAGEDNVIKVSDDYDSGELDYAATFNAPIGSGDFVGLRVHVGLAVFSWDGTELFNSLDVSRSSEMSSLSDFDQIFNFTETKKMVRKFELYDAIFGLGDDQFDSRSYFSDGGRGSTPLNAVETRIASRVRALWAGAPGTISTYMADTTFDTDPDWRVRFDTAHLNESNIDLITEEALQLLDGAHEGLEAELVPTFQSAVDILTPDRMLVTQCMGGGDTHIQPTMLSFGSTSGLRIEGYVTDRRAAVSIVNKPDPVDQPTPPGGRPPVSAVSSFDAGTTSIQGKLSGNAIAANLEVQTQLALMDDGLLDLSAALGDTGTIVDGAYNGIQFNETGATNGNVLTYNSGTWEAGTATGGSSDFTTGFTITDPVGTQANGDTVSVGDDIETYLRDMVVSFQAPEASITAATWSTGGLQHGATWAGDTSVGYTFSNVSNVNSSDTGNLKFSDSYLTNSTTTAPAANSTVTIPANGGVVKIGSDATEGKSTDSRSRSGATKITLDGFTDTLGNALSSTSRSRTIYHRNKILTSTVNYASGIGSGLNTMWSSLASNNSWYAPLSSNPWSSYGSATLNQVAPNQYCYMAIPECIFTYQGGTITGMGTFAVATDTIIGDVNLASVYCGTQDYAPYAGYPVRYVVIRLGQPGELSGKKIKIV